MSGEAERYPSGCTKFDFSLRICQCLYMSEIRKEGMSQEALTNHTYSMLLGLNTDELEEFRKKWLDQTIPGRVDGEVGALAVDFARREQEGSLTPNEIAMQNALAKF